MVTTSNLELCSFKGANSIPGGPGVGMWFRSTHCIIPLSPPWRLVQRSDQSHSINAEAFIEITGQETQSSPDGLPSYKNSLTEVLSENEPTQKESKTEQESKSKSRRQSVRPDSSCI